jgi:ABC-type nitrate/sulfonate/bicarbonate transport system ATPase subunit
MDEPFVALDTALKIRLINSFARLWIEQRKTTLFVTHDVEEALMLGDRIAVLGKNGIIGDFIVERTSFPSEYGAENALRAKLLNCMLQKERE